MARIAFPTSPVPPVTITVFILYMNCIVYLDSVHFLEYAFKKFDLIFLKEVGQYNGIALSTSYPLRTYQNG